MKKKLHALQLRICGFKEHGGQRVNKVDSEGSVCMDKSTELAFSKMQSMRNGTERRN